MESIEYRPIGIIHSPYKTPKGSPIQPTAARGTEGKVEIFPAFDGHSSDKIGWIEGKIPELKNAVDDGRFLID